MYCKDCNCWFYGHDCLNDHFIKKPQAESAMMTEARKELIHQTGQEIPPKIVMASICESRRKCKSCQVTHKVNPKLQQKFLHSKCKNCLEYVNIYDHKCYIMSEFDRDEKREEQRDKYFEKCKQEVMKDVKIATNDSLIDDDDVMNGDSAEDELMNDNILDDNIVMDGNSREDGLTFNIVTDGDSANEDLTDDNVTDADSVDEDLTDEKCKTGRRSSKEMIFADVECHLDETNTFIQNFHLLCKCRKRDHLSPLGDELYSRFYQQIVRMGKRQTRTAYFLPQHAWI